MGAETETKAAAQTETGAGTRMETRGGGRELWNPSHEERSRVEDRALLLRTRRRLCRREVAPAGSQQLRAQDPAPDRRCGTDGRIEQ